MYYVVTIVTSLLDLVGIVLALKDPSSVLHTSLLGCEWWIVSCIIVGTPGSGGLAGVLPYSDYS